MASEEEQLAERIANVKAEAEKQGYKMVHHSRNPDRWRFTRTIEDNWDEEGPFDINQSGEWLSGAQGLKSEPRGNDVYGSIVIPSTAK